ncbi:MAG: hypothetical protein ACE5O2_01950, partial [Armatimonadota bacterium]
MAFSPHAPHVTPALATVLLVVLWGQCASCDPRASDKDTRRHKYIEFFARKRWTVSRRGDYHVRYDRRDLQAVYHLSTTAAAGDHATLTTTVTIPRDWRPPYGLELYCSDDYRYQPSDFKNTGWMAAHAYPGRRFKQVLVVGKVVWDVVVGDVVREQRIGLDLTALVEPGKPFELALRVIDKVATDTPRDGDFFHPGAFEPKKDPKAFMTHVYWGDVLVTERFDPAKLRPWRESPSIRALRRRIRKGLVPRGPARRAKLPARLTLEAPRGAAPGYPLSCGVPLPEGAVADVSLLSLADPAGRDLHAQIRPLSSWPDGSVRWALVTLPLPNGVQPGDEWTVTRGNGAKASEPGVSVAADGDDLVLGNGVLAVRVQDKGAQGIVEVASASGAYATVEEEGRAVRYDAQWDARAITDEGPRQVTVELRGRLMGPRNALGRCTLRLAFTEGSPLVRAWFRIFNDTERHLRISDLAVTQEVRPGPTRGHVATIESPDGWFAVDGDGATVFAAVRWAAEMPTKVMELLEGRLSVHLFKSTDSTPYFRPRMGEARRHEMLFGYFDRRPTDELLASYAACCQRPPRLWNSRYACATGALGYADPHDDSEYARLTENRRNAYGDLTRDRVQQANYDIRDFGDRRYGQTQWCNNYYDASRGFIAEYLMTGNPNAFDRAEEQVLHQIDVDTCHWHTNPSFVGGLWTYQGDDHSNGGYCWAPLRRSLAGWIYYYRMTGDPDVREAARQMAEYVLRDKHHVGFRSVRDHGGTLTALVWAYDEFGDHRYLEAALETMADIHTRMVRRRGPYVEPNGNYSWWLAIPWMASE